MCSFQIGGSRVSKPANSTNEYVGNRLVCFSTTYAPVAKLRDGSMSDPSERMQILIEFAATAPLTADVEKGGRPRFRCCVLEMKVDTGSIRVLAENTTPFCTTFT